MNRRNFLQSTLMMTGAMCLDLPAFASRVSALGQPNLRIGILSDVHIGSENTNTLQHALEYFRDQQVDGVLIAGDIADNGLEKQLQEMADAWYRVFPKDKAPDGHKVEKIFIYGNHDMHGYTWSDNKYGMKDDEFEKQAIGMHPAETWKRCFKEEYSPIYLKTVKGYHFVGAHWHDDNIPGLDTFLKEHEAELKGDKPFFYFQHPHPKNTCNGPWVWGQDDGSVTEILGNYPNAVAFSGHSHMPIGDDRDLWQGTFTSIGTASLSYMCLFGARENSQVDGGKDEPSQMKNISFNHLGKQGMLMKVYDDCITLERREFVYDENVGENWIIPVPFNKQNPLTFENRAKTAKVPEFGSSDKVTITRADGKDRYDKEESQITVHFPSVLKKIQGERAFDYEVQVEMRFVDVVTVSATKRVFSPGCFLGEDKDENEVTCVYSTRELPAGHEIRFAVRPCNCYSKKGAAIYSEWMVL